MSRLRTHRLLAPVEVALRSVGPLRFARLTLFTPDGRNTHTMWTVEAPGLGSISVRPPAWVFKLAERLGHVPRTLSADELQELRSRQPEQGP